MAPSINDNSKQERRTALKKILIGGGIVAGFFTLPSKWISPVVDWIIIPAHAQTSTTVPPVNSATIVCTGVSFVDADNNDVTGNCTEADPEDSGVGSLSIQAPVTLTGNITWDPPTADPTGISIDYVLTHAESHNRIDFSTGSIVTDASGAFRIDNIDPLLSNNPSGCCVSLGYSLSFTDPTYGNSVCTVYACATS